MSSELWISAPTQTFNTVTVFYFSRIKQDCGWTQISGIFLMSEWWMSFTLQCVFRPAGVDDLCALKCREPWGFTSMVVRMMITINIHQLMCWGTNMELNLRSRSLHLCTNRNDFFFSWIYSIYGHSQHSMTPVLCREEWRFWSGAQYTGIYLAHASLPLYFTSGSTFFFW